MGFVWIQSVSAGAKLTNAAAQEIRTNADWLHSNLACYADLSGNYGAEKASDNGAECSGDLNADRGSDCPTDNGSDDNANLTYCPTNLGDLGSDNGSDDNTNCPGDNDVACASDLNSDRGSDCPTNNGSDDNSNQSHNNSEMHSVLAHESTNYFPFYYV